MENLETLQESCICNFACSLTENPDTLYLKVVGIPSSPKRNITKKIDLCNYSENYAVDKDEWEFYSDGEAVPFFNTISDHKDFDDDRENHFSVGG